MLSEPHSLLDALYLHNREVIDQGTYRLLSYYTIMVILLYKYFVYSLVLGISFSINFFAFSNLLMNILRVHIACATAGTEVDTLVVKPVFKCTPQILLIQVTPMQC